MADGPAGIRLTCREAPSGLAALRAWIAANRAIPELSCSQCRLYRIAPLCD